MEDLLLKESGILLVLAFGHWICYVGSFEHWFNAQIMRTLKTSTFLAALVLGIATQAGGALYNITFDDGQGNVGSGQIDVQLANNNYYASSGSLTVVSGQAVGQWYLFTAAGYTTYPNRLTSPAGAFWYNNAVYATGQNPQFPTTNPFLDEYGLLFTQSNGNELNFWGNADGSYTLGGNVGGWQNFNTVIAFGGTSITPVPEPVNCALAGFALLYAGVSGVRCYAGRRRSRAAS